jgi:hypothetical protein
MVVYGEATPQTVATCAMKLDRADSLSFARAGFIVAALMLADLLIAWRLPGLPVSVRIDLGLPLVLPGALVFLPFAMVSHNIHDIWEGYFLLGGVANWVLYTSCVRWFVKTRRKRSLGAQWHCRAGFSGRTGPFSQDFARGAI